VNIVEEIRVQARREAFTEAADIARHMIFAQSPLGRFRYPSEWAVGFAVVAGRLDAIAQTDAKGGT
jgi:hypothetical protein